MFAEESKMVEEKLKTQDDSKTQRNRCRLHKISLFKILQIQRLQNFYHYFLLKDTKWYAVILTP